MVEAALEKRDSRWQGLRVRAGENVGSEGLYLR